MLSAFLDSADVQRTRVPTDTLAAIDLGSNSFHMIVTRLVDGELLVVDRLKEMVQLAAGLTKHHRLTPAAQSRALDCLARFGQRLRDIPDSRVRVVGTNTLRQVRDGGAFLARAEVLLGQPIEVISGMEEARLIYLGVAHSTADNGGRRLVVDIGGGSTELIVGEGFEPLHLESLYMGCVSMTRRHFPKGKVKDSALRAAEIAVQQELEPLVLDYQALGWKRVIGASGTIKTIRDLVVAEGWSHGPITLEALRRLRTLLVQLGDVDAIAARWQLGRARAEVMPGGFAVLYGLCETLGVGQMEVSDGALREGVIYDLLGRIRHEDVRDRTIAALTRRYGLDSVQAERVAATALRLLEQVRESWQLTDEALAHDLEWAARLHEIGLAIAHNHYHRHGAYIIEHSDLAGFAKGEQVLLAALIRGHRRKFPLEVFAALPPHLAECARRLCLLLRLAVVLHRARSRQPLPELQLSASNRGLELRFPPGWLEAHPLTCADLQAEADYLAAAGYRLVCL
ncbi:MAG TPA: Ppx/GppA phosphatase family protein [Candidatus Competibacteraceae bacterium]|nr:Ppx/GppA phosphatase family protein [Candidatus Competibacteraceae bacterium]